MLQLPVPVVFHAEDDTGRRLPVQLPREQRQLREDQTRKSVLLPRGQNVSIRSRRATRYASPRPSLRASVRNNTCATAVAETTHRSTLHTNHRHLQDKTARELRRARSNSRH